MSLTVPQAKEWFKKHAEAAQKASLPYGIFPSVTLAQASIESGYGQNPLTAKANNLFSVKLPGLPKWTKSISYPSDTDKGKFIDYRRYDTIEEAFKDHTDFLLQNSRYKTAGLLTAKNAFEQAYAIAMAGYAGGVPNPAYYAELKKQIEFYNLTQYDTPKKN